ncbi:type IV secretion system DNA-binding domain-containing protein [uncultured Sphingomonas sp.]|uniref:type IV secretion system DNA-binding domain-containing protein n=1 Tax=uncultured Sphingomonas sp. TaxID=158754 RepID=UPI0035CA9C3E
MARDDPKKPRPDRKKDKRKDIRDDGRPLPLKHQSARGELPRNSGNFTRGSQLLNTQVLMWLQGAKMPVLLWLLLFAIAYFAIVSLSLTEMHFQLICMRALSTVWTWVGADPLHHVNLKMPGGYTRSTAIGYVPYVPAVAAAWFKGIHDLLSSMLLATVLTVPVSVWYVDFSARRGKAMVQERHERGATLTDRDTLFREIAEHNREEFVAEARTLFPDKTADEVLKLPFGARKAGGIHHPYSLAGIPYPHRLEQSHTMLLGTTGAGKTTALSACIAQMRQRQDSAVVFDMTGAYVEAFYDAGRDTILNPMDARCPAWSIFNDCRTYSELTAAASALIPSDGGSAEPFWALAARTLFVEMCVKLIEQKETTNQALADHLMTADLKQVHKYLKDTIADPLTAPEAARMAESIRAVFNTNAQALRFLPDTGTRYSIKDWMTGEKKPGSILFITSTYTDLELNRALLTLWSNLAIHSLMTMPRTRDLRTWFMFDELGALHRLPAIENGLQTARNFGGAMVLGLHSFDKLIQVYGEENARNLSSLARTKLILAAANHDTAEVCSQFIGNREIRQMDEGYSYGYNNTRDASTLTPRKQVEPLVIADDITNLPKLHGFVKFPEGFPAAPIRLEWQRYPKVAEGFVRRPPVEPKADSAPVRGGGGSAKKGEGEDAGRGQSLFTEMELQPAADTNRMLAANILSAPSEGQSRDAEGMPLEATVRTDPLPHHHAPLGLPSPSRSNDDERDDRSRGMDSQPARPGRTIDLSRSDYTAPERSEDLAIREARDDFSAGDDGMGM